MPGMAELAKPIDIVGAGPAGSVAAIRLAHLGHPVCLFEKATFPRDKVCGACLSATGIAVLERLGLAAAMQRDLRPAILRHAAAVARDDSMTITPLPDPMWGITRRQMDAWLAEQARLAGADVRMGEAYDLSRVATRACDATVLLADGIGRAIGRVEPTGDFGMKAHFRAVDAAPDTIELVALSAGYAGLAPVEAGLWNAAWSVPATSIKRFGGDLDALFASEVDRSPALRRRFARATRIGDWLACPLPRYRVRRAWPANVIPIGNAAAALEPVGGEGMGLAMRSAELAAEAVDGAMRLGRPVDVDRLRAAFDRLWQRRRVACRVGALALSHPILGPLTIGIANRAPTVARVGLAIIGK